MKLLQDGEYLTPSDMDKDQRVVGVIRMDLSFLIKHDEETILDEISNRLTGTDMLKGFSWDVIGHAPDDVILLKVEGDAEDCWRDFDEIR